MIVWNQVTWYSKLAAVIFFLGILPVLTFYIGMQYQATRDVLSVDVSTTEVVEKQMLPADSRVKTESVNVISAGDRLFDYHYKLENEHVNLRSIDKGISFSNNSLPVFTIETAPKEMNVEIKARGCSQTKCRYYLGISVSDELKKGMYPVTISYSNQGKKLTEDFVVEVPELIPNANIGMADESLNAAMKQVISFDDKNCDKLQIVPNRFTKNTIGYFCKDDKDHSWDQTHYIFTTQGAYTTVPEKGKSLVINLSKGDTVFESPVNKNIGMSNVEIEICEKDACSTDDLIFGTTTLSFDDFVRDRIKTANEKLSNLDLDGFSEKLTFSIRKIGDLNILIENGHMYFDDFSGRNVYFYLGNGVYYEIYNPAFAADDVRLVE